MTQMSLLNMALSGIFGITIGIIVSRRLLFRRKLKNKDFFEVIKAENKKRFKKSILEIKRVEAHTFLDEEKDEKFKLFYPAYFAAKNDDGSYILFAINKINGITLMIIEFTSQQKLINYLHKNKPQRS